MRYGADATEARLRNAKPDSARRAGVFGNPDVFVAHVPVLESSWDDHRNRRWQDSRHGASAGTRNTNRCAVLIGSVTASTMRKRANRACEDEPFLAVETLHRRVRRGGERSRIGSTLCSVTRRRDDSFAQQWFEIGALQMIRPECARSRVPESGAWQPNTIGQQCERPESQSTATDLN